MQVLVVSRDPRLAGWLVRTLRDTGWTVRAAATPTAALAILDEWSPALVATDEGPAALSGAWVEAARRVGARLAIVAPRWVDGELEAALGAGADTYVQCPVGDHELVARLRAVTRWAPVVSPPPVAGDAKVRLGSLCLDRQAGTVTAGGATVPLARRELDIVEALLLAAPKVVGRDELSRVLTAIDPMPLNLDVLVRRVRTRLEAEEGWRRIEAVRGVGFRMLADDDRRPAFTTSPPSGHDPFERPRERVSP